MMPGTLLFVPSLHDAGRAYRVEATHDGWACECPRFAFGKSGTRTCRHVELAAWARRLLNRCRHLYDNEGHPEPDYGICPQCLVELLALVARRVRGGYVPKAEAKAKVAAARKRKKASRIIERT